jgi:hypothetical protein
MNRIQYGSVDRIRSDLTSGTSDEKRECMGYDSYLKSRESPNKGIGCVNVIWTGNELEGLSYQIGSG